MNDKNRLELPYFNSDYALTIHLSYIVTSFFPDVLTLLPDLGISTNPEDTFTKSGDTASLSCTVKVPAGTQSFLEEVYVQ